MIDGVVLFLFVDLLFFLLNQLYRVLLLCLLLLFTLLFNHGDHLLCLSLLHLNLRRRLVSDVNKQSGPAVLPFAAISFLLIMSLKAYLHTC